MALSFDDRILGEKVDNYCSSSEDEDEGPTLEEPPVEPPSMSAYKGHCTNTGPKGVINDWQKYKKLETERREEQEREKLQLYKNSSITCRSFADDVKAESEPSPLDMADVIKEVEDEFMEEYRRRRMEELRKTFGLQPQFGDVSVLDKDSFVSAIDDESPRTLILVHIYEDNIPGCNALNGCFECLAAEYPTVKFCKIRASDAQMSRNFSREGVPAIVVYKNKQLIGNLINVSKQLGDDFYSVDVESFLLEHGFLPDKIIDPSASSIRVAELLEESDSDFDLD